MTHLTGTNFSYASLDDLAEIEVSASTLSIPRSPLSLGASASDMVHVGSNYIYLAFNTDNFVRIIDRLTLTLHSSIDSGTGNDIFKFVNPLFSQDVTLYGITNDGKLKALDVAAGTITELRDEARPFSSITDAAIVGVSHLIIGDDFGSVIFWDPISDTIGFFNLSLSPFFITNIFDLCYLPKTTTFGLVNNSVSRRNIIFKVPDYCHSSCGTDCFFPPEIDVDHKCSACTGTDNNFNSVNGCELTCSTGEYPAADYQSCITCPTCCPSCEITVPAPFAGLTYPYVPNTDDLTCSALTSGFDYFEGSCVDTSVLYNYVLSINSLNTIVTIQFENKAPNSITSLDNLKFENLIDPVEWVEGVDYNLTIQVDPVNELLYLVTIEYLRPSFDERFKFAIGNMESTKFDGNTFTYADKEFEFDHSKVAPIEEEPEEETITLTTTE
jgi:hypothetical protein